MVITFDSPDDAFDGGELLYGLSNIRIFHFAEDDSVAR